MTAEQMDDKHQDEQMDAHITSILYPFKTLSSHTHQTPIALSPISNTLYSASKFSFSRFNLPRLSLIDNGPDLGTDDTQESNMDREHSPITMIRVKEPKKGHELAYVASGNVIYMVKGNIVLRKIVNREAIVSFCWLGTLLVVLGTRHIALFDEAHLKKEDSHLNMDHSHTDIDHTHLDSNESYFSKYISRVPLPQDSTPTNVMHLPTYLNKVLVSTHEGHIDLVNVMNGDQIYRYGPYQRTNSDRIDRDLFLLRQRQAANKSSFAKVTYMEAVPNTLDIVAIGLSDGKILVHDMYTDETLCTFCHSPGPIKSISFRTDGVPTMVSGTMSGSVAVWNLMTGKLIENYPNAHNDSIISLQFISDTSLLVSSGEDNAIKLWEFESSEKMTLAFSAEGHAQPPSKLRFYGPSGKWIVSAGKDRQIRMTNLDSGMSRSFQHSRYTGWAVSGKSKKRNRNRETLDEQIEAMRPPIIDFDFSFMRERDWPNLITAHAKDRTVSTWIVRDAAMGKSAMIGLKNDADTTCVSVSPCGNHAVVGRKNGRLEKWNLQSCLKKGEFKRPIEEDEDVEASFAHSTMVNGAIIDNTNHHVYSVGFDGYFRVWNLSTLKLVHEHNFKVPVSKVVKAKNSNMIAISFADFSIRLLDGESFKVIRNLKGHQFIVNDMTFSSDGRYLYSCGKDNFIIIWDIISADKVEWLELPQPATSIDVDSKDMYIVTSHAASVGISIWINKIAFGVGALRQVTHPVKVSLPMMGDSFHYSGGLSDGSMGSFAMKDEDAEESDLLSDKEFRQLLSHLYNSNQKKMISQLGGSAEQKVMAIRKLDVLRERSKTQEDSDDMKHHVPFFLETQADEHLQTQFVTDESIKSSNMNDESPHEVVESVQPDNGSRISKNMPSPATSRLIQLIVDANYSGDYSEVERYLKDSSPKMIDMSVRLLSAMDDYFEVVHFLKFLIHALQEGNHFDLTQSLLKLFLQVHDEVIISGTDNAELYKLLEDIHQIQDKSWQRIDKSMKSNLFLCKHLSNLQ